MTQMISRENTTKKALFIAHDDKFIKHFLIEHKKTFESLGFDVVYATNNKYGSFDKSVDSTVFDIEIQQSPFKVLKNIKALKQVVKYVNDKNVGVIYAHTPVGGVIGRLVKVFNKNVKVIYLPHGYHFLKGSSASSWLLYYPVEKVLSYLTDLTITINREDYTITRKRMNKNMQVELINGVGVSVDHDGYVPVLREKGTVFNITHVAELNDNKNQLCLLKAVEIISDRSKEDNRIPNFKVYFIGEGKNMELLQKYALDHKLYPHYEFLGYINNVEDYLRNSHCAISCSKREGLPVNLIESLSYGIPIVATNCRGNRDVVQNGVNGYLTSFNDEVELADRIIDLMLESDEYIANFNDSNIMKSKIYSVEVVNDQLYSILANVIGDNKQEVKL